MSDATLLAACQSALRRPFPLQEGGDVRIHTAFSHPRPVRSLYPLAHIHPSDGQASSASDAPTVWQEHVMVTASWKAGDDERLMYALEAYVYTVPAAGAGLLYISKLDSTGYGPTVLPGRTHLPDAYRHAPSITTALTAATIAYFASRAHWRMSPHIRHVSVHVLARAQAAYLFPSSPDNKAKRVLSDAALIRWWQACLSESIAQVREAHPADAVSAYYVIPGYARLDSHPLVPLLAAGAEHAPGSRGSKLSEAQWVYGHPYSALGSGKAPDALPSLPLHPAPSEERTVHGNNALHRRTLSTMIPIFPDDPKGRFINEMCATAHEPGKLPAPGEDGARLSLEHREAMAERQTLDRTSADAFWERMGFRQECSSGNAVGVFVVGVSQSKEAARAPADAPPPSDRTTPPAQPFALPHPMLEDLVLKHLLRDACHWSDADQAVRLTGQFYQALDRAMRRKASADTTADELAGRGEIWDICSLPPAPPSVAAAGKRSADAHEPPSAPAAPVRVLSVKRKRRS